MTLDSYSSFPATIPLLLQESIIYPFMIVPLFLDKKEDIEKIESALDSNSLVFITTENKAGSIGTIGAIIRKVHLPDQKVKILFQGITKGVLLDDQKTVDTLKLDPYDPKEIDALLDLLKDHAYRYADANSNFPKDIIKTIDEKNDPYRIVDLITSSSKIPKEKATQIYKETNIETAIVTLIGFLIEEVESLKVKKELSQKVSKTINQHNKEYFLKQQLNMLQEELGVENYQNEEVEEYTKKLELLKKKMPEEGYKEVKKQIDRLTRIHPDSSEYSTTQDYIEWILNIPFGKESKENFSVLALEERLNKEHYSLKKAKERIVEYFASKELTKLRGKDFKGTIICFVGPPGVGKTSLANSIAKSLKRELVRIALGGIEDVSELRGHRRTYVASMPGRIIQGLINAKTMNPVVVLDEIDKIARHRGDPTSVLLEVLDPEQNSHFRDLYVNFEVDLSKAMFIATANDIGRVPTPLRDRLEIISVESYTPQEKFQIAKKYLISQELKKHALTKNDVTLTDGALKEIIDKYTKEAGVRNLRKQIAKIMRKTAKKVLNKEEKISINIKNLKKYLEKAYFGIDEVEKKDKVGVVNGLAWTAVGGDVLTIESVKFKAKGGLQLTGSLGDVMKESAKIALTIVKAMIDEKKLLLEEDESEKESIYNRYALHIHVPEGSTPKDGPSAGITMTTAIASCFSDKKVRHDVAMTGEVTLTGDVLPIGGLKEKLIAAYKAKIKTALIPQKNFDRDLDEVPAEVKSAMDIIPVKRIEEVLTHALL